MAGDKDLRAGLARVSIGGSQGFSNWDGDEEGFAFLNVSIRGNYTLVSENGKGAMRAKMHVSGFPFSDSIGRYGAVQPTRFFLNVLNNYGESSSPGLPSSPVFEGGLEEVSIKVYPFFGTVEGRIFKHGKLNFREEEGAVWENIVGLSERELAGLGLMTCDLSDDIVYIEVEHSSSSSTITFSLAVDFKIPVPKQVFEKLDQERGIYCSHRNRIPIGQSGLCGCSLSFD